VEDIRDRIRRQICAWEGVSAHPHRFGGTEFRLGKRELGHLHDGDPADMWADLPFTRRIREMLIETGRAERHRFGVEGWVSHDLDEEVVELFRLSYERARIAQKVRDSRSEQLGEARRADVPAAQDHADPAT
jgi:hypothetical protein